MTCLNVSVPINSLYQPQSDDIVETVVDDILCVLSSDAGEKPSHRELCNLEPCPVWQTSEYSEVGYAWHIAIHYAIH